METIFEKAIDLKHNNFLTVESKVPQIESEVDYNENELSRSIEQYKNKDLITFKKTRYESYKQWGFPKWKRTKLNGYNPLKYIEKINPKISGNPLSIDNIDEEGLKILAKYDMEGANRKFFLMSDTFFNTGFYIKTEKNEEKKPIILEYNLDNPIYENTIFNIKENSKVTVVRILNGSNEDGFRTTSLRGVLGKNAELTIINVAHLGDKDINIDNALFEVGENATVNVYDLHISGRISSPHYIFRLSGENSNAFMKPYFLGYNDNIIDMFYLIRFYGKNTTGDITGKGVLKDLSKAVFRGTLDIKKNAKEANASESEHTLLLSEKSRAEAIPSLLVDENEVNASHAASVGTLNEDTLYYLMTRGFSKVEAKRLLSLAIFESFIDEVEKYHKETSEVIRNVIESKI
ncbi:SufD family Fe-S cluster assembly protein [Oceanotoga sp. DSM 15011]|uniref:SufD family Fe-S cluster assembly protein n=1 Tax=Oceanotoga sp. DSM 15011 TaxID=2984951 RepID=UPI0021F41961|nr:SufD family Fe-S cluster assembly protein [Oceanotoga sp. DSM 15011]UYO99711.1 SufD family Fe-S cluster assembly protein [Oceanotoga sp. DSM 15011]